MPQVYQNEVLAVFPVRGRAGCGQGGRTLLLCFPKVLFYTPLVIIVSRRHGVLAMVAAVLGRYHPRPGTVCTQSISCPGWNTGYGLSVLLLSACLSARSVRFLRTTVAQKAICILFPVFRANSSVCAVLPT